jgi:hypothetical protein
MIKLARHALTAFLALEPLAVEDGDNQAAAMREHLSDLWGNAWLELQDDGEEGRAVCHGVIPEYTALIEQQRELIEVLMNERSRVTLL